MDVSVPTAAAGSKRSGEKVPTKKPASNGKAAGCLAYPIMVRFGSDKDQPSDATKLTLLTPVDIAELVTNEPWFGLKLPRSTVSSQTKMDVSGRNNFLAESSHSSTIRSQ
jgi:hypothetical protein